MKSANNCVLTAPDSASLIIVERCQSANTNVMSKKSKRPSVDQLREALALPDDKSATRMQIYEDYRQHTPMISELSVLQQALGHNDDFVVQVAASSIGKLGKEALVVAGEGLTLDLCCAGSRTNGSYPPQAYMDCLEALVSINADPSAIIDLVHCHFGITNWLAVRASLEALKRTATSEAMDLLKRIVVFWWPELDKKQQEFVRTHFPESSGLT